jgi:hypothetical protein
MITTISAEMDEATTAKLKLDTYALGEALPQLMFEIQSEGMA